MLKKPTPSVDSPLISAHAVRVQYQPAPPVGMESPLSQANKASRVNVLNVVSIQAAPIQAAPIQAAPIQAAPIQAALLGVVVEPTMAGEGPQVSPLVAADTLAANTLAANTLAANTLAANTLAANTQHTKSLSSPQNLKALKKACRPSERIHGHSHRARLFTLDP